MSHGAWLPTPDELGRVRDLQQRACRDCETLAGALRPGISERVTAARWKTWLQDHSVRECFHQPCAWFGSRPAFKGFGGLSSNLRVERLMDDLPHVRHCRERGLLAPRKEAA